MLAHQNFSSGKINRVRYSLSKLRHASVDHPRRKYGVSSFFIGFSFLLFLYEFCSYLTFGRHDQSLLFQLELFSGSVPDDIVLAPAALGPCLLLLYTMLDTISTIIVGSSILLLVATCVAGNLLVCLAIYHDSRLRRTENLYLASLAVADLLVAGVMTLAGVNDLLGRWVFGAKLCHLWIAVDIMCCTASIFNLCAIALDRYIHIRDPFRYPVVVTKRVVLSSIAAVWVVAGGVSLLSLWFHRSSGLPQCSLDLAPLYAIASSTISFCLPCLMMAAIYWQLYILSRSHCHTIGPSSTDDKAAVTIGIIMGIFLACWLPFFCANILDAFYPECISPLLFKLLTWLGYSNSVFNPIVYSVFNREFRECFKLIVMRRLSKQSVKNVSSIDS